MSKEGQTGDALPTIIVDRQSRYERLGDGAQLGDYIDLIDFDTDHIRQVCYEFGFDDTAIEDLIIHAGCNPGVHSVRTAEYRNPSSTIRIYPWRQSMVHAQETSDDASRFVRIEHDTTLSQDLGQELLRMAYSKGYYESSEVGAIRTWGKTRSVLGYLAMSVITLVGINAAAVGMRAGPSPPTPIMAVGGVLAGVWIGGVGLLHNRRLHDTERVRRQVAYEIRRMSHMKFAQMVHVEPKTHDA